jgi:hypothetical protein
MVRYMLGWGAIRKQVEDTQKTTAKDAESRRRSSAREDFATQRSLNTAWFSKLTLVPLDGERFTNHATGEPAKQPLYLLAKVVFNNRFCIPDMQRTGRNGTVFKDVRLVQLKETLDGKEDIIRFLKRLEYKSLGHMCLRKLEKLAVAGGSELQNAAAAKRSTFLQEEFTTPLREHISRYNDVHHERKALGGGRIQVQSLIHDITVGGLYVRKGRRKSSVFRTDYDRQQTWTNLV